MKISRIWTAVFAAALTAGVAAPDLQAKDEKKGSDRGARASARSHSERASRGEVRAQSRTRDTASRDSRSTRPSRDDAEKRVEAQIDRRAFTAQRSAPARRADTARREIPRERIEAFREQERARDRSRPEVTVRNRERYTHRHERHPHEWYRDNGWVYDRDYWVTHRRHRYYNDALSAFIFDVTAPADSTYYTATPAPLYDVAGAGFETRVAVQQELGRAGYYHGVVDGVLGPGTRSAIFAYQADFGLPQSGEIDNFLLRSLGLQ